VNKNEQFTPPIGAISIAFRVPHARCLTRLPFSACQKHLRINKKYVVRDEEEQPILFVVQQEVVLQAE
jgi:hypothetical protein